MHQVRVRVRGMDCRHRVREVTASLRDLPGAVMVSADAGTGVVTVTGTMADAEVLGAVAGCGYEVASVDDAPSARPA